MLLLIVFVKFALGRGLWQIQIPALRCCLCSRFALFTVKHLKRFLQNVTWPNWSWIPKKETAKLWVESVGFIMGTQHGYHLQGTRCFSTAKGCFVRYQAPLFDICLLCCGRCNICRPLTFIGNTGSPLCYLLKVGFVLECFLKLPYESTTGMISSCWLWVHRFLKRGGVKGGVGSPKVFFHVFLLEVQRFRVTDPLLGTPLFSKGNIKEN